MGGHRYTSLQFLRFSLQLTTLYSRRTVMLHINISNENRVVSFPLDESVLLDNVDQKGIDGNTGVGREDVALRAVVPTSHGTLFRGLSVYEHTNRLLRV
jgi:hypothetical protein